MIAPCSPSLDVPFLPTQRNNKTFFKLTIKPKVLNVSGIARHLHKLSAIVSSSLQNNMMEIGIESLLKYDPT